MNLVGILAFGSLINDPGEEITSKIAHRVKTETPFPVEYARPSGKTRGGAPTLVRHRAGKRVNAEILILDGSITINEARDMLWRRERRKIGTGERYVEGTTPNSVLVRTIVNDPRVANIHYTEFHDTGKIAEPTGADLAKRAIESVASARPGMDGISYLIGAIESGIETSLTREYHDEILAQTKTCSLVDAREMAKAMCTLKEA